MLYDENDSKFMGERKGNLLSKIFSFEKLIEQRIFSLLLLYIIYVSNKPKILAKNPAVHSSTPTIAPFLSLPTFNLPIKNPLHIIAHPISTCSAGLEDPHM